MNKYGVTRTMTDVIIVEAETQKDAEEQARKALDEVRFYGVSGCTWDKEPIITARVSWVTG